MVTGMKGDRARSALSDSRFAELRWVDETGSTNHDLLAEAAAGAPGGTVLVADHQTAGRGRLERSWVTPPGTSLLVSVLLRPRLEPVFAPLLTVAMALALVDTGAGQRAGGMLKWPNDVVVDGEPPRKLAGVLAESTIGPAGELAVVVGVGINVNWPTPVPPELVAATGPATALNLELGAEVDREDLLVDLLSRFETRCGQLEEGEVVGRQRLLHDARQHSITLGRRVRADVGGRVLEGLALDLDDRGDLLVRDDAGREHRVVAGDVLLLRHDE